MSFPCGDKLVTYTNVSYGIVKFIPNSTTYSNIFCSLIPKKFQLLQYLFKLFAYFIHIF